MIQFGTCSVCGNEISNEKVLDNIAVCDCGHLHSFKKESKPKLISRFQLSVAVFAMTLVAGFVHLVQWDGHSLSVIPLKIKQFSGGSSSEDLKALSQICTERLKWSCVADSLEARYRMSPETELETLGELGELHYKLGETKQAAAVLKAYSEKGGKNEKLQYVYAQSLGRLGMIDEAIAVYDAILSSRSDVLQITVAQNYVKLLIQNDRKKEAKTVLARLRKLGENTSGFMEKEFSELGHGRAIASDNSKNTHMERVNVTF